MVVGFAGVYQPCLALLLDQPCLALLLDSYCSLDGWGIYLQSRDLQRLKEKVVLSSRLQHETIFNNKRVSEWFTGYEGACPLSLIV